MSTFYKDTRYNGKLLRLEDVIEEVYNRALETIDDGLYELLNDKDDDEFYMDYKEAFGHIVEELQKFHNVEE
jgi:Tfp pilus assembly ATPase PilU